MATSEERESARRRLDIHRRNLRQLEEQAAKYVGDVPIHISNQIDEQRVNIAALEPIASPPQGDDTQLFVARVGDGNGGNWAMLFSQFVLLNTRQTKQEEQNARIIDEQGLARQWRMNAGQDIEALKDDTQAGAWGRQRNFWMLVSSLALSLIALGGVVWLVFR
jgi:hypothetical protein